MTFLLKIDSSGLEGAHAPPHPPLSLEAEKYALVEGLEGVAYPPLDKIVVFIYDNCGVRMAHTATLHLQVYIQSVSSDKDVRVQYWRTKQRETKEELSELECVCCCKFKRRQSPAGHG